jgi:excisionase family DNA binding protein
LLDVADVASRVAELRSMHDVELVRAMLERDDAAWRELMRRHVGALRAAARDASDTLTEGEVDDVVSELWLSLIESDMRSLRTFEPARGAPLLSWLTIRLSQIVYKREQRRLEQPTMVPLHEAGEIPDPKPAPSPELSGRTLMRVEEVAKRWGLDRKTVYAMIERGQLSSRRCGRLVRIPRGVVESFELQASVAPGRNTKCR